MKDMGKQKSRQNNNNKKKRTQRQKRQERQEKEKENQIDTWCASRGMFHPRWQKHIINKHLAWSW